MESPVKQQLDDPSLNDVDTLEERSQVSDYQRGDELALKPPDLRAFNPPSTHRDQSPPSYRVDLCGRVAGPWLIGAAGAVSSVPRLNETTPRVAFGRPGGCERDKFRVPHACRRANIGMSHEP